MFKRDETHIIEMTRILSVTIVLLIAIISGASADNPNAFQYVDSKGNIDFPTDFRSTWVHLGSWLVTSRVVTSPNGPGSGFHDVYTQPESYRVFKKTGKWPDGAALVKEVRTMKWDDLPTGHVIYADEKSSCFVMIKDSKGRFKDNPNWGEGWGWALFKVGDPKKNISTDYKEDCLSCHEAAKETDWVFIRGYPTLR